MSVRDLKQQLQSMTPAERREVAELLVEIEQTESPSATAQARGNVRPGFEEMAAEIFSEHRELMARLAQ